MESLRRSAGASACRPAERRNDGHGRYVLQRGYFHRQRRGRIGPALHERAVLQPHHRPVPVAGYLHRLRLRPLDAAPLRLLQQQPRQHGRSDGARSRRPHAQEHGLYQ